MSTVQPVFEVALRRCFSDGSSAPVDFACARETYTFFDNLEIGTTYEVEVSAIAGGRRLATATRKFTTDATAPRLINVPGIPNVRDLGGRVGLDGKRMRQGLIYRTAGLNDNPEEIDFLTWAQCRAEFDAGTLTNRPCWQAGHMANIYRGLHPSNDWHRVPIDWNRGRERLTDEARKIMLDKLGIRTDLDLRGAGEVAGTSRTSRRSQSSASPSSTASRRSFLMRSGWFFVSSSRLSITITPATGRLFSNSTRMLSYSVTSTQ